MPGPNDHKGIATNEHIRQLNIPAKAYSDIQIDAIEINFTKHTFAECQSFGEYVGVRTVKRGQPEWTAVYDLRKYSLVF